MIKTQKLTFIDGNFSNEEAKEMLMKVVSTKINYLKIRNWSSQERYGIADASALENISALKQGEEKLMQIIAEARAQKKALTISSAINISLADD